MLSCYCSLCAACCYKTHQPAHCKNDYGAGGKVYRYVSMLKCPVRWIRRHCDRLGGETYRKLRLTSQMPWVFFLLLCVLIVLPSSCCCCFFVFALCTTYVKLINFECPISVDFTLSRRKSELQFDPESRINKEICSIVVAAIVVVVVLGTVAECSWMNIGISVVVMI